MYTEVKAKEIIEAVEIDEYMWVEISPMEPVMATIARNYYPDIPMNAIECQKIDEITPVMVITRHNGRIKCWGVSCQCTGCNCCEAAETEDDQGIEVCADCHDYYVDNDGDVICSKHPDHDPDHN